jgi:hypothetical protein
MKTFVIDFRGSLVVQADSEEEAHKKGDAWAQLVEERTARTLLPEVTAVMLRCRKKESDLSKKARRALLEASLATETDADDKGGDKKNKKQKKS